VAGFYSNWRSSNLDGDGAHTTSRFYVIASTFDVVTRRRVTTLSCSDLLDDGGLAPILNLIFCHVFVFPKHFGNENFNFDI
jgi:hypothetical protein